MECSTETSISTKDTGQETLDLAFNPDSCQKTFYSYLDVHVVHPPLVEHRLGFFVVVPPGSEPRGSEERLGGVFRDVEPELFLHDRVAPWGQDEQLADHSWDRQIGINWCPKNVDDE